MQRLSRHLLPVNKHIQTLSSGASTFGDTRFFAMFDGPVHDELLITR